MRFTTPLPIDEALPGLKAALAAGSRAVLVALGLQVTAAHVDLGLAHLLGSAQAAAATFPKP